MGVAIAISIVVAIVIGVGVALGLRRRSARTREPAAPARPPRPEPAPMTGLEDALAQVTDRSGTTLRDRLDAESDHVEQLRVTDDTGPLLRRALDHVDRPAVGHEPPGPSVTPSDPSVGEAAGDDATARHERGESPTS